MTLIWHAVCGFTLACLGLSMLFCAWRLIIGPAAQDRVVALDTLWVCAMLLAIVLGIALGRQVYFNVAMLIALTGFVATVALTKFLMRGEIIE